MTALNQSCNVIFYQRCDNIRCVHFKLVFESILTFRFSLIIIWNINSILLISMHFIYLNTQFLLWLCCWYRRYRYLNFLVMCSIHTLPCKDFTLYLSYAKVYIVDIHNIDSISTYKFSLVIEQRFTVAFICCFDS